METETLQIEDLNTVLWESFRWAELDYERCKAAQISHREGEKYCFAVMPKAQSGQGCLAAAQMWNLLRLWGAGEGGLEKLWDLSRALESRHWFLGDRCAFTSWGLMGLLGRGEDRTSLSYKTQACCFLKEGPEQVWGELGTIYLAFVSFSGSDFQAHSCVSLHVPRWFMC